MMEKKNKCDRQKEISVNNSDRVHDTLNCGASSVTLEPWCHRENESK